MVVIDIEPRDGDPAKHGKHLREQGRVPGVEVLRVEKRQSQQRKAEVVSRIDGDVHVGRDERT